MRASQSTIVTCSETGDSDEVTAERETMTGRERKRDGERYRERERQRQRERERARERERERVSWRVYYGAVRSLSRGVPINMN